MKTTMKILTLVSFLSLFVRRCRPRGRGRGAPRPGERAGRRREGSRRRAGGREDVLGVLGRPGVRRRGRLGTDADCAVAGRTAGTTLPADRVGTVTVAAGQVACVASTSERKIELMWHAQPVTSAPALIARR